MPYCTDCGKKLPDNAIFCPNCGHRVSQDQEIFTGCDKKNCSTQGEAQSSGNEECQQCTDNDSNTYTSKDQPQADTGSAYRLDPNIYKNSSSTENSRKNGAKTAVIVICTVLALLIIAAALIMSLSGRKCIGYWKSSDVNLGGLYLPDMYDENPQNLIAVQIEKDHEIYLISAFEDGIMSGNWEKTRKGIEAKINDDDLDFVYNKNDDTLILIIDEGLHIVFERAEGSIYDSNNKNEPSSVSEGVEQDTVNTISGSGSVGDGNYNISVIGAEQFSDIDGSPAMRVYFEFTNNSNHNARAREELKCYAKQDSKELDETYSWDDVDIFRNIDRYIRPGVKIQCCYEFKYNPKGGSIDFVLFDYNLGTDGGTVTATYTPDELPGRPADSIIKMIDDPKWAISLPSEGYLDEEYFVSVTDAELVYDYHDNPAIRVYLEFSNNSDDKVSVNDVLYSYAYQDGISLDLTCTTVCSESDDNYYEGVDPGEKTRVSCVFLLRNESSPVEAEIESSNKLLGQTYKLS